LARRSSPVPVHPKIDGKAILAPFFGNHANAPQRPFRSFKTYFYIIYLII
jgi:hypothetical protein